MTYRVAERFKSIQGEGVFTGTPMAFIRFVGCSVGKRICQHCDTDFEKELPWRGGGELTAADLHQWMEDYEHVCLTGGEPFDQDLRELLDPESYPERVWHIETSGTIPIPEYFEHIDFKYWICVSPKPGFLEEVVRSAHEVKVIVPGLGNLSPGLLAHLADAQDTSYRWPTPDDALRWAHAGKIVFLQPRNGKLDIDHANLGLCQDIIRDHPELRLSVQMHKILRVQ